MNLNTSQENLAHIQSALLLNHLRGASITPQPGLHGFPYHPFITPSPAEQQQMYNNFHLLIQRGILQAAGNVPTDSWVPNQLRTPAPNVESRNRGPRKCSTVFPTRRVRVPASSDESKHSTVSSSSVSSTETSGEPTKKQPGNRPEKLFTCLTCDRSFGYKHVLQNHERTHTGEKPFQCTQCEKRFTRDHHLKTHMRLHTGEKPYNCPQCDKTFVQVANLRRHVRVHTGEKPYKCSYEDCKAVFSDSNQLKFHRTSVHNEEKVKEETPYMCQACGTAFSRRALLNKHQCLPSSSSSTTPPPPRTIVGHHDSNYNYQEEPMEGIATPDTPESSDGSSTPQPRDPSEFLMNLGVGVMFYPGPVQTEPQDLRVRNKRITEKTESF